MIANNETLVAGRMENFFIMNCQSASKEANRSA
jgi:hypothetical protein